MVAPSRAAAVARMERDIRPPDDFRGFLPSPPSLKTWVHSPAPSRRLPVDGRAGEAGQAEENILRSRSGCRPARSSRECAGPDARQPISRKGMKMSLRAMTLAAATLLVPVADAPAAEVLAATERTVYVTVTDNKGAPVSDLTAADLVVKEGGKEREITKAAPATAKMRLTLAVEERLIADTSIRQAIFEFLKRMIDYAEIRMITIGLRNQTVADYTSSLDVLVGAINKFTLNPMQESNVAEGVLEIAAHYAEAKVERPVLVVLAISGGQAGVDPRTVLDKLRQSGTMMTRRRWRGAATAAPSEPSPIRAVANRCSATARSSRAAAASRCRAPARSPRPCSRSPTSSARSTPSPTRCPTASSPTSASASAASARGSRCARLRLSRTAESDSYLGTVTVTVDEATFPASSLQATVIV